MASKFELARKVTDEITTTLALQPEWIQAIVLAELTGRFLANYVIEGDHGATAVMRFNVLQALLETAQDLASTADEYREAGHA